MVRTTGDSLCSINAVFAAHGGGAGCTLFRFFLLQTALPGGLPLWLERRIGGCNWRWCMKFYMLCQARGHRGRWCLCFQQWECYHGRPVNIFHVFSMGVWLDRLVSHEWQSWNELQKCSLLRPRTCKPTDESEGAADKPQGFISVLFSLGIVWRSWGGWELKINVLLFFFLFISTLWFKKRWESEIYLFHKQLWGANAIISMLVVKTCSWELRQEWVVLV